MTLKRLWILSLLLGLITTFLAFRYFSSLETKANQETNYIDVVVAKVDIPPRTRITEDMVYLVKMDARYAPPNTLSSLQEVVGKINRWRILEGEPVLSPRLVDEESPETRLAYKIPAGHRAISLVYTPTMGVGGYIKAGDRVDVIGTFEGVKKNGQAVSMISQFILQDVLVLAVGKTMIPEEESPDGKPDKKEEIETVTLAVTPLDAERITFAEEFGKIRLVLRPALEKGQVTPRGATPDNILNP